jgi:hypothetical protein
LKEIVRTTNRSIDAFRSMNAQESLPTWEAGPSRLIMYCATAHE